MLDEPDEAAVAVVNTGLTIDRTRLRGDAGRGIQITGDASPGAPARFDAETLDISGFTAGIELTEATASGLVVNSEITRCETGVAMAEGGRLEIWNSAISRCTAGIAAGGTGNDGSSQPSSLAGYNLIFYWNDSDVSADPDAEIEIGWSFTDSPSAVPPWPGMVNGDPRVVDPWNGNWHPLWDSPLIDAGRGTGHPAFDREGRERIDDSAIPNSGSGSVPFVDIGLFEFSAGQPAPPDPDSLFIRPLVVWPNPSSGNVLLSVEVRGEGELELTVHDVLGREVYRKSVPVWAAGRNRITWQGRDHSGAPVANGIYFCTVREGNRQHSAKIVLLH